MTVLKITRPAVVSTSSVRISPAPSLAAASQTSSSTLIGAWTCTCPSWVTMTASFALANALPAPFSLGSSMVR